MVTLALCTVSDQTCDSLFFLGGGGGGGEGGIYIFLVTGVGFK